VIADAADPSPDDADAAVAAARRAFDTSPWPGMSVAERAKYLGDFCDRFEQSLPDTPSPVTMKVRGR